MALTGAGGWQRLFPGPPAPSRPVPGPPLSPGGPVCKYLTCKEDPDSREPPCPSQGTQRVDTSSDHGQLDQALRYTAARDLVSDGLADSGPVQAPANYWSSGHTLGAPRVTLPWAGAGLWVGWGESHPGCVAHHPSWPWDCQLPEVPGRAETGDGRLWPWQAHLGASPGLQWAQGLGRGPPHACTAPEPWSSRTV